MKTVVLIVLIALEAAASKPSPRIVGGHDALPHSIPYQALLTNFGSQGSTQTTWSCSGSIISHYYILTSARCVDGANSTSVTLGVHNSSVREPTQVTYQAVEIRKHPDYVADTYYLHNDIALVRVNLEIPYNDYIQPVALPSSAEILDQESYVGHTGRSSGWGYTDGFDDASSSDVLKYFDAPVIKSTECRLYFANIYSSTLCTFADGDDRICFGDVGGPLVADFKQIGISSFFGIFCLSDFASGYTRITSFMDWIEENSDIVII